jgi:FRG domain
MPPYTVLPRPAGHLNFSYSPMSPGNWGIAPSNFHVMVYPTVETAMKALLQATTTIQAQRLESGDAALLNDNFLFRGQVDATWRLLPTRLRPVTSPSTSRQRYSVDNPPKVVFNGQEFPMRSFKGPPGFDPKDHFGDWYEEVEPIRENDALAKELEPEMPARDARAKQELARALLLRGIQEMDDFRRLAAVRHYSSAPSSFLDVSTSPEVAAFFATGAGKTLPVGQIGILWAIDLNALSDLFSFEIIDIPHGTRLRAKEEREKWGANKEMFESQGILPISPELNFVSLPFRRPIAQHARFFRLTDKNEAPMPLLTELTWWSIIERRGAAACAFLQSGTTYENVKHNITRSSLLPETEEIASALQ